MKKRKKKRVTLDLLIPEHRKLSQLASRAGCSRAQLLRVALEVMRDLMQGGRTLVVQKDGSAVELQLAGHTLTRLHHHRVYVEVDRTSADQIGRALG